MRAAAFLALALVFGQAEPAAADPVLKFGFAADYPYPPFFVRGTDGEWTGADVVTARRVAAALHARAEFVTTTWPTLVADFAAGRFDIAIGGLTITPERAAAGVFSLPLMTDGKRPLARCADAARFATIAAIDQPGVRVMINRGPGVAELAKGWFHRATITVNPDDTTLTSTLLAGGADVWVTDGVVVDHMARRFAGKLCATTQQPFTHLEKAWLIRNDPALIASVNAALGEALRDGSWQAALEAVP